MNYYNHHIGDYSRDTGHLSMLEHGAYRKMLDIYYATEKPLPLDRARLYRLLSCQRGLERSTVDSVLTEFFSERDDGWHHKRCDEELSKASEKSEKARAAAMRSVSVRTSERSNVRSTDAPANAHTDVQLTNNQEPIANSQQPIASSQTHSALDKPKPREKKKRGANALAVYERPPWLPPEWETYLQLRREKGVTLAPTWLAASLNQLDTWRIEGHDVAEILRRSVSNGWTGIFPPNGNGMRAPPNRQEALEQRNRLVADSWMPPEMRDAER